MTTLYICRHGETENNKNGRLSGWIDTPLTEAGKRNALSAARKLQGIAVDQIVSSDLGRAFATAYIISRRIGYTSEIKMRRDLREMNYGDWANQPFSVYPPLSPAENTKFAPPNGESLYHMQQRVLECIRQLGLQYEGKTVLIVAHDGTINALKAAFAKRSIGAEDATHSAHGFVAKLAWNAGEITSFAEIA